VGQIAPGRYADLLLVKDLSSFVIDRVIAKGRLVAEGGRLTIDIPAFEYPEEVKSSVHLGRRLTTNDFRVVAENDGECMVNIIGVIENQAPTSHLQLAMRARRGEVPVDTSRDIAKVALVERHRATGEVQVGFVHGFGLNISCAIASTVAHDSHHMVVVGTEESNMAMAANELARVGGGQVVVIEGQVRALVELPIGGLMSNERAETVADKASQVLDAFRQCGCTLNNPNMQLSLLALVVIPELRISDKGLVDVQKFEIIPVIEGSI
jgi:adenine deaminase